MNASGRVAARSGAVVAIHAASSRAGSDAVITAGAIDRLTLPNTQLANLTAVNVSSG